MKKILCTNFSLLLFMWFISPSALHAQVRLTEVAPTNTGQLTDEDNDRPDWIEIQNGGTQVANLYGWGLSDGLSKKRWLLPETDLQPGERLIVFASGKNRGSGTIDPNAVNHWETALYDSDEWQYRLGTTPPPADWNSPGFDASGWSAGAGGFGYGDNDDVTTVPNGTLTVYYRRNFFVSDPGELVRAVLSMDYDDGFVAYLNGQEIARSSNISGTPDYMTLAVPDRESTGLPPEDYNVDALTLLQLLKPGVNTLAVEIHNTSSGSSDMSGRSWLHFGLTSDNQLYGPVPSWFNPGVIPGNVMHTDFKLDFSDKLILSDPNGVIKDSLTIGYLHPGHSRMRINDDGAWCTTANPTPGNTNGWDCLSGYAPLPGFALSAGFYSGTQSIALSGPGEIRYTTDGSIPTANSNLYAGPLQVATTTVVRARSFDTNLWPSAVATSTYFIDEPTTLTAVSISLPPEDFSEVYDNYSRKGSVAVEYFDQDKQRRFAGDFAGYVVGNWSVTFAQKSLQFDADEDYGSLDEINYPIFAPDKPIPALHSFRIRNEDDDWVQARMRDRIVNELAAETHSGRASYKNVAAFINGEYWGHYVARERLDNYFVRDNFGADPDSVQMVKTYLNLASGNTEDVAESGTLDDFQSMTSFIANSNMTNPDNFNKASQLLDLDNFTDYIATEVFVASTDWLQDYYNNIRLFKTRKNAPWKFLLWDVSYSSGNASGCASCNVLGSTLGNNSRYGHMLTNLLDNQEYRRYFINRFADLMNTSFLPARAHALIDRNAAELGPEIDRQNQRWGTGDFNSWSQSVEALRNFYSERPANQRGHIIDNFQLDQEVSITLDVNPPGAGTVKISTVVPESLPWTGIYFHGNPVTVTAIANPGFTFSNWVANPNIGDPSAVSFTADVPGNTVFTANFSGAAEALSLKISEINYHSDPTRDGGDWFEIRNEGNTAIDLSDFSVRDKDWFHRFTIPTGTYLLPFDIIVLADNLQKFHAEYPAVANVLNLPLGFELSDKSDEIHVFSRNKLEACGAAYSHESPWPDLADGFGLTLERHVAGFDPNQSGSWFVGCIGGSPGVPHSYCVESFYLSEVNYHAADNADSGDWFELRNPNPAPLDLSGWQLRDGSNDHQFVFPTPTQITPAERFRVIYQDEALFSSQHPDVANKTGPFGFGFNGSSDMIRVYDANGKLFLNMRYSDTAPWPVKADGGGYTLEKPDFSDLINDPYSWQAGCPGGSPGVAFDPDCGTVDAIDLFRKHPVPTAWPNPATKQVTVQLGEGFESEVQLVDVCGKIVVRQFAEKGTAVFSTSRLPRGLYFARVFTNSGNLVLKIILE